MAKKQIVLRLSDQLYQDIAAWAADDFRSVNGQIEFILSECVKRRRKNLSAPPPNAQVFAEPTPGESDSSFADRFAQEERQGEEDGGLP